MVYEKKPIIEVIEVKLYIPRA